MVDQEAVRLAGDDGRRPGGTRRGGGHNPRDGGLGCRSRGASGTGSPKWIVNVMRETLAAIRQGMTMAPVAAESRNQARGHVEREALPVPPNMPVVPAFHRHHQDPARPQVVVRRAQLGPMEDAGSIRASGHGAGAHRYNASRGAAPRRDGPEAPPPPAAPAQPPVAKQDHRPEMQGGQDDRPAEGMVPFHLLQTDKAATVLPSPP